MISNPDDLRAAFAGTALDHRDLTELPIPDLHEPDVLHPEQDVVVVVPIEAQELLRTWTAARALVDITGRWPVAITDWGGGMEGNGGIAAAFSRFFFREEQIGSTDPRAIVQQSANVDVGSELRRIAEHRSDRPVPSPSSPIPPADAGHLEWFDPGDQPVALALLPDDVSEHTLAYVHWFAGSIVSPSHVLIAILAAWRATYGAEIVANWGTMLQLIVQRPPDSWAHALRLAWEQEQVAECTTILPGVSLEEHAAALMTTDRWFLHERP